MQIRVYRINKATKDANGEIGAARLASVGKRGKEMKRFHHASQAGLSVPPLGASGGLCVGVVVV